MGRVSREHAAENRAKVVAAASTLFRRRGLDGVGIDELMAEAGLTRGGFYGQFGSKDELAGEACAHAFECVEAAWSRSGAASDLLHAAKSYFASGSVGHDCPMATLAGDAARAPVGGPVRRAFTSGLRRLVRMVAGEAPDDKALVVMAAMVGAEILRRASEDEELSDSMVSAVLRFAAAPAISPNQRIHDINRA